MKRVLAALALLVALPMLPAQATQTPVPLFTGVSGSNPIVFPADQADLNNLISAINGILSPLQPRQASAVNFIALTPAVTGMGPTIGLQPGADTNAAIHIAGNGNGDIALGSYTGQDTGVLRFASAIQFLPAPGLAPCPGASPTAQTVTAGGVLENSGDHAGLGPSNHLGGFIPVADWLKRVRYIPVCSG